MPGMVHSTISAEIRTITILLPTELNVSFTSTGICIRFLLCLSKATAHILQKLQPAYMDASDRAECLPGTRVAIIKLVTDWALDPTTTQNALWVHGLAGMGKSTLSTTVANRFREMGCLGAFVFFSRDVAERSNPATVIRTLAYQIGSFHPRVGTAISTAIEKFPGVCLSPLSVQFQKLLVEPLASVIDRHSTRNTCSRNRRLGRVWDVKETGGLVGGTHRATESTSHLHSHSYSESL
jgi:hypothetical protein